MKRTLTATLALATLGAAFAVPSEAAKPKPKPKPIKGSYSVRLVPDPTPNATNQVGETACNPYVAQTQDSRPFTLPAAGSFQVVLDSVDPTKGGAPVGPDWDLYVYDNGGLLGSATSPYAHEEVIVSVKKKTPVRIVVCNLNGAPDATVNYTFTYK